MTVKMAAPVAEHFSKAPRTRNFKGLCNGGGNVKTIIRSAENISYVLLSRTEIFNVMIYIFLHSLHLTTFLHVKMRWQMFYNLLLVNKIQE